MAKSLIHGSFLARKEIYIFYASLNQSSFGGWSGKVQFSKKNYYRNTLHWKKSKMPIFIILNMYISFSAYHSDLKNEDYIIDGVFDDRFNASPELVIFQTMQIVIETGQKRVSSVHLV